MRVLVLDDDPELNATLRDLLILNGHDVVAVTSVAQAEDACGATSPFDVAVLDINLRDENSIAFMRNIKRAAPQVRVVVITGGGTVEPRVGLPIATAQGADAVMFKPFTNDEFLGAVSGNN